jgi:tartrate-resistant acid phosphatase type 5
MKPVIAIALLALLSACGSSDPPPAPRTGAVRFIVIGDFGTGRAEQFLVARAMQEVCAQRGCDFIVTTGDNIYEGGVISANDPQFEQKFEIPYRDLDAPWYLSLGNHDVGADPVTGGDIGDYQVAYTYRTDRMSGKWHMPARFFSVAQGPVALFLLDTNRISADGETGTDDSTWLPEQRPWLVSALGASDATWKFVFGHHPYRSNGGHGNAPEAYQAALRDTVCGEADAFFAGHDHILQWLEQVDDCPGTELLISGGGGQTPDLAAGTADNPSHYYAFNTYGFLYVQVEGSRWTGTFYNEQAQPLFERTVSKPL